MARTITEPDAAATFARVIASDLSLYNEAAIAESLRSGRPFEGLDDQLVEARVLFLERVPRALDPVRLLVRTLVEYFSRWAGERGLPVDGLARGLASRLAPDTVVPLALVVRAGLRTIGQVLPLADGITVLGGSSEADIELEAATVARRHAQLTLSIIGSTAGTDATTTTHVEVQDLGSQSGTWVNGELVRAPTSLALGDVLQLGVVVLELVRA